MKSSLFKTLSFWVLPGLLAGVLFLAVALVTGVLSTTVWGMPDGIAQAVGVAAPAGYGFALVPVVVGIAVHLALSIVLGVIFAAFVSWRRLNRWQVIAAAGIFVTLETPIALWVVMHKVLPAATFDYFLAAIPWWGSVLGHYLYAGALGVLLAFHPATAVYNKPRQSPASLPASA